MNLRRAYELHPKNSRSVKHAVRHVIFLRGKRPQGAFVIIDDFEKDDQAHVYSHHFHPGPDVSVESTGGARIILKGKQASCLVALVHPGGVSIEARESFKHKYLEAVLGKPRVRLNLITVLYPTRDDPSKAPVSAAADPDTITVRVADRTVVFDASRREVRIDGTAAPDLTAKAKIKD